MTRNWGILVLSEVWLFSEGWWSQHKPSVASCYQPRLSTTWSFLCERLYPHCWFELVVQATRRWSSDDVSPQTCAEGPWRSPRPTQLHIPAGRWPRTCAEGQEQLGRCPCTGRTLPPMSPRSSPPVAYTCHEIVDFSYIYV